MVWKNNEMDYGLKENEWSYDKNISIVPAEEILLVCGDLNSHVGKNSSGFESLHEGHGYGVRNPEGTRILKVLQKI